MTEDVATDPRGTAVDLGRTATAIRSASESVEQIAIAGGRTLGRRLTDGIEMLSNTKGSVAR